MNNCTTKSLIDLSSEVWAVEKFKTTNLAVHHSKTMAICRKIIGTEEATNWWVFTYTNDFIKACQQWIEMDSEDNESIYSVSSALDQIAQRTIKEVDLSLSENKEKTLEKRIKTIFENKQKISILKQNLRNHNIIIEEHNTSFFTKDCPTHEQTIALLSKKYDELEEVENKLKFGQCSEAIELLKIRFPGGLAFDSLPYFQIIDLMKTLDLAQQTELKSKIHTRLNTHYMMTLKEHLFKEGNLILPNSIASLLNHLGLSKKLKIRELQIARSVSSMIDEYLKDSKAIASTSPLEAIEKLHKDLIGTIVKGLNCEDIDKINLKEVLIKCLKFEGLLHERVAFEQKECLQIFSDKIRENTDYNAKIKEVFLDKINHFLFKDATPGIILKFIGDIMNNPTTGLQQLERKECKRSISRYLLTTYYQEMELDLHVFEQKEAFGWFEKNKDATRFRYSQNEWGIHEILGNGVCAAINYRWIKKLMQKPFQSINSMDEFEGFSIKKGSRISSKDRLDQATYTLDMKFAREPTFHMGRTILKRDKMNNQALVKNEKSVGKMVDSLYKNHYPRPLGVDDEGIFDISIYHLGGNKSNKGHSLGMQIHPTQGLYRFWDVNSGFYEYNSLEELKANFEDYMVKFYKHTDYNSFTACQYTKKVGEI